MHAVAAIWHRKELTQNPMTDADPDRLKPLSLSSEREIFRNRFIRLYSVIANFKDFTREYFVTDKGLRVGTLLLRDGDIFLVRQYRFLINGMSWEIPGGGVEDGESFEDAARRECREEASVECGNLREVFSYQQGIDVTKSPAHIFECSEFDILPHAENVETDTRQWVPFESAIEMALNGEIQDSFTMMAILSYNQLRRDRG